MAREAESRLHGGEAESEIGSSAGREEEEPRVSSSRAGSAALASDVSFRSSGASSSSSSLVYDEESYGGGDGGFPWTQSEYEEIPSFRWIASPLRWWTTKKVSDLSRKNTVDTRSASRGEEPATPGGPSRVSETSKSLVHFDGHRVFTLEELLRAKAKTLGKSTYWAVYKVSLEDGDQVVVRRLTWVEAAIERITWHPEVDVLGKIRHPNLLAPRAYHYNPEGYNKFLVFDYMPKGSLSAFLHCRGHGTPIDWPTRMNIAIGITRGLHYLHTQGNMVHGNLSSKNVLLDYHGNAKIADYGLSKLLSPAANSNLMKTTLASGYHAPELSKLRRANTKTDVYSLGMIMLELLTGKSPWEADLHQWFTSIVKEDGSLDVFGHALSERRAEDLLNALTVALQCVRLSPDARPDVVQVLNQLSEIIA